MSFLSEWHACGACGSNIYTSHYHGSYIYRTAIYAYVVGIVRSVRIHACLDLQASHASKVAECNGRDNTSSGTRQVAAHTEDSEQIRVCIVRPRTHAVMK